MHAIFAGRHRDKLCHNGERSGWRRYDAHVPISGDAAAELSPSVTPAPGKPALLLGAFDIASVGYVAEEFFISGSASSYGPAAELTPDGRWSVSPAAAADYTTRIVVLTPSDLGRFNGTVLVEWLNVSGGIDAPAVWMMAHREMLRAGYAYVAVSAQRVGVEGGENLMGIDMSLKSQDAQRYSPLHHPGDAYAYDIFSQAGRLARNEEILRGLRAEHVIALGESQSALFLTTYRRSRFVPIYAYRLSQSSPRQTCSVAVDRAITARDSLTINDFGCGRSPARLMPTTTRFRWRRSTPGLRR
jgi:hypothetical protein